MGTLQLFLDSTFSVLHYPLSASPTWPWNRMDRSSCSVSRALEGTASVLHSLSVMNYTAASKQWHVQQSRSQLSWPTLPSGEPGRRDRRSIPQGPLLESLGPFPFKCRMSKMTVVLSVKQDARPRELSGSGGWSRRLTELMDRGRRRFVTSNVFTSPCPCSSVIKQ